MIRILFDHQIFSEQRYGGISRYFVNLAQGLSKTRLFTVKIAVLYTRNYYLESYPQLFDHALGRWFLRKEHKRYYWNRKFSKSLLEKGNYDIFHATYYDPYSININRKPLVVTVHDMIHENNPEFHANAAEIISCKRKMIDAATAIIAISNFTRDELIKHYPQQAEKITVVYHGIPNSEPKICNDTSFLPKLPYLLFVGERGLYKNFNLLASAVAPLIKEKDMKLVCAGGKEFSREEKKFLEQIGITEHCIQINATDEQLTTLYQNAVLFAYPSSQEGFGLPILEAFQNRCAIACSDQSCLPEIGGDAVGYFNPNSKDSILSAVKEIIENQGYRETLVNKGKERLKIFNMDTCIEQTAQVYQKVFKPQQVN